MSTSNIGTQRVQWRHDEPAPADLRAVPIWVPYVGAAGFVEECARQVRLILAVHNQGDVEPDAWASVPDISGWTA